MFGLLSTAYSKALECLIQKGPRIVTITNRLFWSLFYKAWTKAFTQDQILQAFEKLGIWPPNAEQVLGILQKPALPTTLIQANSAITPLKTPLTCQAIRRAHRAFKLDPNQNRLDKILNANI